MKRFILDGRYGDLFKYYGINLEEVLRKADIPEDIFCRKSFAMTQE